MKVKQKALSIDLHWAPQRNCNQKVSISPVISEIRGQIGKQRQMFANIVKQFLVCRI